MIAENYSELTVLSIASFDSTESAFSADTGLAECIVVARKKFDDQQENDSMRFISLRRRPVDFAYASTVAQGIRRLKEVRNLSDGPFGGTPIMVGDEFAGEAVDSLCDKLGSAWKATRVCDFSLAQVANGLGNSELQLPGKRSSIQIDIVPLSSIASRGPYDMNIAGNSDSAAFERFQASETATFPSLWKHSAPNETQLICQPDTELRVRPGMEAKAQLIWDTACRVHLNKDFRFNSQPLAVSFTETDSVGGRAWLSVQLPKSEQDYAFALWGNCTLGLLLYWWHANLQQSGRGNITVSAADSFPILNVSNLDSDQLLAAQSIFDEFRDKHFLPAHLADVDSTRQLLDRKVVCDLLRFDESVYLAVRQIAVKWCAEPTVFGGKPRKH